MLIVGIDEAGLGPRLGPLVPTAACFRGPEGDLWEKLAPAVSRDPRDAGDHTVVCDSKALYSSKKRNLRPLEESALSFLAAEGSEALPAEATGFLRRLGEDPARLESGYPWYRDLAARALPQHTFSSVLARRSEALAGSLARAGYRFLGFTTSCCDVKRFNAGIARFQNKATFHTEAVADLICRVHARAEPDEPVCIDCDRLGGRKRYGRFLYERLAGPHDLKILEQDDNISAYRLTCQETGRPTTVRFLTKGDRRSFAVGLAAIVCKYLRELLVGQLNEFFAGHQPTLKPTAGYPQDAARFLEDTAALRERLGIADEVLVRVR